MPIHIYLFYLTLILLPTQLGLHMWPDWALVLGRRIDYLSPTLFLTDITILLTLIVWIVSQKKLHLQKKYVPILCGTVLIMGVNILFSVSPMVSLYKWIKFIEFFCFGFYIYKTKPKFRYVVIALSIAAAYSSCIGILQFFLQRSIGGALWFLGERSFTMMTSGIARTNWCWFTTTHCLELLRPYATFSHPNVLGGYLMIMMFLMAVTLKSERTKQIRVWYFSTIVLSFITLIFSLSRSAWLIGIFAVILYLFSIKQNLMKKIAIGLGLLVCICITFPYFLMLTPWSESVILRYNLAFSAMQLFFRHPIFGTGLGTFLVALPSVAFSRDLFFIQPVHNIFLLWMVETGIIGIIFGGVAIHRYYSYLRAHNVHAFQYIPIILLIILGLVDHYPLSVQQGQLLFTLLIALPFLNFRNS